MTKHMKPDKAQDQPAPSIDALGVLRVLDEAASTAPLTRQGHINVQQAVKILTSILTPRATAEQESGEEKAE